MVAVSTDSSALEPVGEVTPSAPVATAPEQAARPEYIPEPARTVPYPEQATGSVVDVLV